MLSPREVRLIAYILENSDGDSFSLRTLLRYCLERSGEPAAPPIPSDPPPHPDTVRLEWLENHAADLIESGGEWSIDGTSVSEFMFDDPRSAIDHAMREKP